MAITIRSAWLRLMGISLTGLWGCQSAQLAQKQNLQSVIQPVSQSSVSLPKAPTFIKVQPEGQVKIESQTLTLNIKLPPLKESDFATQLLDLGSAAKITASVKDSYGKIYYPDGADANHQVAYPSNGVLSLTFSNVLPDPLLFVNLQVVDSGSSDIVQADLATVLRHTGIGNPSTTINFQTTAVAKTMANLLSNNATRARAIDLNSLNTLMATITGMVGTAPNLAYNYHPSLVKTAQLATDLLTNNPWTLTASAYRGNGATVRVTVSNLGISDRVNLQVTDAASAVRTNLANGLTPILSVTPGAGLQLKVSGSASNQSLYTYSITPSSTLTLSEGEIQDVAVVATPTLRLTSFSPTFGTAGETVTLTGLGFTGTSSVSFNGLAASFVVDSDTQITVTVPVGISDGKITLVKGGTVSSSSNFHVPRILRVNAAASPGGNGSSWATAYQDLQNTLKNIALAGDEIWVAAGSYLPVMPAAATPTLQERDLSFQLREHINIYGGFAGTENSRSDRTASLTDYVTYLSGDLDQNDDYSGPAPGTNFDNNSQNVVKGANHALLDGVTIRGGNRTSSPGGGGMLNNAVSPTLSNLSFSNNRSAVDGGGLYASESSSTLTNVIFSHNHSVVGSLGGGGMYVTGSTSRPVLTSVMFSSNTTANGHGGGMSIRENAFAAFTNVSFNNNQAGTDSGSTKNAGGLDVIGASATLLNVSFSNNRASHYAGAAVFVVSPSSSLTNVIFTNNSAVGRAGALYLSSASIPIKHVTFSNNTSVTEPVFGGMYVVNTTPVLQNVLFYLSQHASLNLDSQQGSFDASSDPFVNSAIPNGADGIPFTADDGLRLNSSAAFINQGINAGVLTDILGNPRVGVHEPGAYEYSP